MDEIDKSKENIQPLRQGRNTEQLCEALSECKQRKHIAQMQQFEMNLRSYEGDDPMQPWFEYISWMEQTSTGRGKQFREILKQCLKNFSGVESYLNDDRLVDLWLKYLSVQQNKMELYETVLGHGIGVTSATFYIRWAEDLEATGDLRSANRILQRAIEANAVPKESIEKAINRLCFRAAKTEPDNYPEPDGPQRAVFGTLEARSDGRVAAERAQALPLVPSRQVVKSVSEEAVAPFLVFSGTENVKPRRQLLRELPDEKARAENEAAPSKWTDAASGRDAKPMLSTPFEVLEDPIPSVMATPKNKLPVKRVLQEVKHQKEPEWPLAYFEPVNDKIKPMYCKAKVYCGGTEFSFEELRAEAWRKRKMSAQHKIEEPPVKVQRVEMLVFKAIHDGEEFSCEELRAKKYLNKLREKLEVPVALFEPENPNQVCMYDRHRVYVDNTEFSLEELRARDWVARSNNQSVLFGQSMTVHTREALAAVEDLWISRRETPPATPPKLNFDIYQDTQSAPIFKVFSDPPIIQAPVSAPFPIFTDNQENVAGENSKAAPLKVFADNEGVKYFGGPDRRPVLQPRLDIMVGDMHVTEATEQAPEEESDEEEEFVPQPYPRLPELPHVPPPEHRTENGIENDENRVPEAAFLPPTEKESRAPKKSFGIEDEDTCFVIGPLCNGPVSYLDDVTVNLMKKPPPSLSSTPFMHQPQSLLMQPQDTRHTILSPILEMTGESRGSRSGSSSSSGVSTASSKAFSLYLKTPGQSVAAETEHLVAPVKLELLEEEPEEISASKDKDSMGNIIEDPWSTQLQQRLVPCIEGILYYDGSMPVARANQAYRYGKRSLKLKKVLGEGAYGKVYKAEEPLVVKLITKDVTGWELHISRSLRRRVPSHLIEHFCEISSAVIYSNGTILEMPFKSEVTLLSAVNAKQNMSEATKSYLLYQILLITDALIDAQIIHTDIKPDNFLVVPIRHGSNFKFHLQLIDFGRCIDLSHLPPDVQFTASLKGENKCVAMRNQQPWHFDLDLYATAATAHVVIFGKYMTLHDVKSVWKPTSKPKRFWQLANLYEKMLEDLINPADDVKMKIKYYLEQLAQHAAEDKVLVNDELSAASHVD
ncbi:uncharacterized protein LOC135946778 [Cloeon dipterum]|uniref:uncharacterized protein LOC135946778 n=1 Tax=Cloeon dipterum TaxID=197152 RepID=UPI0032208366